MYSPTKYFFASLFPQWKLSTQCRQALFCIFGLTLSSVIVIQLVPCAIVRDDSISIRVDLTRVEVVVIVLVDAGHQCPAPVVLGHIAVGLEGPIAIRPHPLALLVLHLLEHVWSAPLQQLQCHLWGSQGHKTG